MSISSKVGELTDEAIIYQLEKVDQGGEVSDLVESRIEYLAKSWGFDIEDDEESPFYGDMILPDGRHIVWDLKFEIKYED